MNIDEIDIFVMKSIFDAYKNKKETNHWIITKEYAKKKGIKCDGVLFKKNIEFQNLFRKVRMRLEHYCDDGIFVKEKNGNGDFVYVMDLSKISFVRHKFGEKYEDCLLINLACVKKL